MSVTLSAPSPIALPRAPLDRPVLLLVAFVAWAAAGTTTALWPGIKVFDWSVETAAFETAFGVLVFAAWVAYPWLRGFARWLKLRAAWLVAIPSALTLWEIASAKTGWWPQPFFPPPQGLVSIYGTEYWKLAEHLGSSLILLGSGYLLGAVAGFVAGVAIGWSHRVGYWLHPVLRFIGPVPATALLPVVLFVFPTSFSASVFLIALSTWFPVTVLTWSGVASVPKAFYDVARTLGASQRFLLIKVAVPGALPHLFVGLFMGLGHAFAVLIIAEMMGVKAGLGFYLQWAQGWAAYPNLYAALVLMAFVFSTITTLLFRTRDRILSYQKSDVQW